MEKDMEMDKFEARCMAADVGMAVEPGQERTVEMVTLEIRTLHKQAQQVVLGYKEYVKAWEYKDLSEAAAKGYNWGSNLNLFGGLSDMFDTSKYTENVPAYNELAGIGDDVSDIAGSANSIQKAVNMSEEDLKSLVDVAERRYVNNINLTAQSPVINVTGQNTGNTQADRMNLANTIRDILVEQVASGSTVNTSTSLF